MSVKSMPTDSKTKGQSREKFNFSSASMNIPLPEPLRNQLSDYFLDGTTKLSITRTELEKAAAEYVTRMTGIPCSRDLVCFGVDFRELRYFIQTQTEMHLALVTPLDRKHLNVAFTGAGTQSFIDTQAAEQWRLMPSTLEKWCRTKPPGSKEVLVYLPHSPAGTLYRPADLKGLADVAERQNLYFLREEYVDGRDQNLWNFYPKGTILYINPFRNTTASPWGLGFAVFPPVLRNMCTGLREHLLTLGRSISDAPLLAAQHFFSSERDNSQREVLQKFSALLTTEIREIFIGSEVSFIQPEQGFAFFLDLEAYRTRFGRKEVYGAAEMCRKIHEATGVKLVPGTELGCTSSALLAGLWLTNFSTKQVLDASATQPVNTSFLYKHCWDTVEGVQKLVRYLRAL